MGIDAVQRGSTEAAILARVIQAHAGMDAHAARYLLSLAFEPADVERINLLSARSGNGELSPEEAVELESYIHIGNLLSIVQSKARLYLKANDNRTLPGLERITIEAGKRSGQPCIRGLRITVWDVLGWLGAGMTEDEILDDYPDLEKADFAAVYQFAAERGRQMSRGPFRSGFMPDGAPKTDT